MANYTKKEAKPKETIVNEDVITEGYTTEIVKDEVETEVESVKEETKSSSDADLIAKLQQQMLDMQQLIINMQMNNNTQPSYNTGSPDSTMYEIGTRLINGASIYSPNKEVSIEVPFNNTVTIDGNDLNSLLKQNFVKDWFEKDLIFFTDASVYDTKRIKRIYDLSDENIISIIKDNSTSDAISVLNKMTKDMKDDPMIHCLFYRIVELCDNGKLSSMNYETRKQIEKIFGFKIDDANMLFRGFRNIK